MRTDEYKTANPRLVGLDLLRLLAIVLVLGRHLWAAPEDWPAGPRAVVDAWRRGGWIGVDLFFVLSGFLISGLLFSEYRTRGRISPIRFYIRRGWKIYPPFFVLIGVTVALSLVFDRFVGWSKLAAEVFFLQSYFPGVWGHTWSLAVEEHFYFLLPLVLMLVLRLNRRSPAPLHALLPIGAWIAGSALFLRVINWQVRTGFGDMTHLCATHLRLDSLFFGVVISYLYHFHTDRFVRRLTPWRFALIGAGVVLLSPVFVVPVETAPWIFTAGLTVLYLGSGMLLTGVHLCNIQRNRALLPLAALGAYSYSIYLWHLPVFLWGIPLAESAIGTRFGFGLRALLYLSGSLGVGVAMAKLVEVPSLRLRDRWFPARSDVAPAARRFEKPRENDTPALAPAE